MTKQQLNIKLKQNLGLWPGLQQSINILQMSSFELQEAIAQEMSINPFLQLNGIDDNTILPTQEALVNQEYYNPNSDKSDRDPFDNISNKESLIDHVLEQINLEDIQPRNLAYFLAQVLDDNGYIQVEFNKISQDLNIQSQELELIISRLQKLDPAGIFARNLSECLALQLKNKGIFDSVFAIILANLNLVAQKNFSLLGNLCKCNLKQISERISIIQKLNPKPGASFSNETSSYKLPNIIIQASDNQVTANLAPIDSYDLSFNQGYYKMAKQQQNNKDNREFFRRSYLSGNQLIKSIKKRNQTLLAVAELLAEKQKNFFLKGMLFFNPITLTEIADELSIAQSTVCRAVANKYLKAPWGDIYDMKFFFSSFVSAKNSTSKVSSTKVKELIKQIIDQEDYPLSDNEISLELAKFDINISRRTVTKYRESLDIIKSHFRKKLLS
jgi:RNA polymerase sigma-54 factor